MQRGNRRKFGKLNTVKKYSLESCAREGKRRVHEKTENNTGKHGQESTETQDQESKTRKKVKIKRERQDKKQEKDKKNQSRKNSMD